MGDLHMTDDPAFNSDTETVNVTVETAVRPTFDLTWPVDDDETVADAIDRASELARHDASVALADTADEYEWTVTDVEIDNGSDDDA